MHPRIAPSNKNSVTFLRAIGFAVVFLGFASLPAASLPSPQETSAAKFDAQHPSFDVASIRENKSGFSASGDRPHSNFPIGSDNAYSPTGGEFSATNLPLISYIIFAYKITTNNRNALIASVPQWVLSDGYNIEARTDFRDATKDQMRLMMRSLLADRFKLAAHHEQRDAPVFAAVLDRSGKLGPQLRKHSPDAPCPQPGSPQQTSGGGNHRGPVTDSAGFPLVCNAFANYLPPAAPYHRRFGGGNLPLATIVSSFSGLGKLGRPVVDETGLSGGYDFFLDYLLDPPPGQELPSDADGPTFVEALRTQLGINLKRTHSNIDFVIVDHIERPSPN